MKVLPNITGMRFLLSLLVILFHIPPFCKNQKLPYIEIFQDISIFNKGTESVYMFFSLSGFLIIRLLFLEKKTNKIISLKKFFTRRALRILPIYFFVLLFGLLYYNIILPKFGYNFESNYTLTQGLFLSIFFMPNIFAIMYSPGGIIEILWSIGIEEQFYLLFAPLLFLIPIKKIVLFLILFTLFYFIIIFNDNFTSLYKFKMVYYYFSASGVFSILTLNSELLKKIYYLKIPIYIIIVVYFTTFFFNNNLSTTSYHLLSMLLFPILISVLIYKPIFILNNRIINYFGKISYGLYMYHTILMQIAGYTFLKIISNFNFHKNINILYIYVFILTGTILFAHLSYKYYESYFMNRKKR